MGEAGQFDLDTLRALAMFRAVLLQTYIGPALRQLLLEDFLGFAVPASLERARRGDPWSAVKLRRQGEAANTVLSTLALADAVVGGMSSSGSSGSGSKAVVSPFSDMPPPAASL